MSADTDGSGEKSPPMPVNISLSLGENGELWVARDEDTGVVSQGPNRQAALENLDTAVAGYHGAGDEPTEDALRDLGIDPDQNTSGDRSDSDIF
jgi:predicted RNase H-like HicB family nuclease